MVTIPHRNVPAVCGASYHLLGYRISQDSKIRFWLQFKSYISDWLFSELRLLASYVSRHKAMAYDTPTLFRHSRTLSGHWRSTSSTPPKTPSAYWWSTLAPIALFVKVSPGRACNDYNVIFLCWCKMTNLSATFFISQNLALTWSDNTFVILKSPCCESWDIQGQSLSRGFKALSCTTLSPGLGARICLATF
jgi:hypothetical protein